MKYASLTGNVKQDSDVGYSIGFVDLVCWSKQCEVLRRCIFVGMVASCLGHVSLSLFFFYHHSGQSHSMPALFCICSLHKWETWYDICNAKCSCNHDILCCQVIYKGLAEYIMFGVKSYATPSHPTNIVMSEFDEFCCSLD